MTKKTKTFLFLLTAIFFAAASPLTIFYTQGYRIDVDNKRIVQTGGLAIKTWPKQAEVYIDGELKKKTNYFFGQVFIDDLLPKKYTVRIEKDGYIGWQKELEITEKMVTDAQNIVLAPTNLEWQNTQSDESKIIENAWLSPDGNYITLGQSGPEGERLKLIETKSQKFTEIKLDDRTQLENITWSKNNRTLLFELKIGNIKRYAIWQNDNPNFIFNDFLDRNGNRIKDVFFNPGQSEKLLVGLTDGQNQDVWDIAWLGGSPENLVLDNTLAFYVIQEGIIWLNAEGRIYLSDFSGNIIKTINAEPIVLQTKYQYHLLALNPKKIFLRGGKTLFWLNPTTQQLENIAANAGDPIFSSDTKKAAYVAGHELWVFYLEKIDAQPRKQEGMRNLITRISKPIDQVYWADTQHIIFYGDERLKFTEIDDRDGMNINDIPMPDTAGEKIFFFSQSDKRIYALAENKLFASKELLPD